jgi:hypothetical protein
VLTSTLVGFGAPRAVAIMGVITYRLLNFWLPIPLGALASLHLKLSPGEKKRTQAEIIRLAEASYPDKDDARRWAIRHGFKVKEGSGAEGAD